MKVLLVCPPWYKLFGGGMDNVLIGVGYLAAVLKKNGIETNIYNADYNPITNISESEITEKFGEYLRIQQNLKHNIWREVRKTISSFDPDIVGLTAMTGKFKSALNVAKICKQINPDIITVVGGPHASCAPEEAIRSQYIDFVIRGEGEYTFLELVKSIDNKQDLKGILGLTFKDDTGKIVNNPNRPLIENLDELPFPFREFYVNKKDMKKTTSEGIIFATRGCPYQCIFCASSRIWTRKVRYRSAENIVAELAELKNNYDLRFIRFDDDAFTINKDFVTRVCDLIIQKKLGINWYCSTRVDMITKGLLEKMKASGCIQISFGVESGSDETLKRIKKGINKQQIKRAFQLAKEAKIYTGAYVMIGFPWETEKDMLETINFAIGLEPSYIIFSIVTPYPGTELYDICCKMDVLPSEIRWEEFFHQSPNIILTKMSKEKFSSLVRKIEEMVENYNRKSRLRRIRDISFILKVLKRFRRNPRMLFAITKKLLFG